MSLFVLGSGRLNKTYNLLHLQQVKLVCTITEYLDCNVFLSVTCQFVLLCTWTVRVTFAIEIPLHL